MIWQNFVNNYKAAAATTIVVDDCCGPNICPNFQACQFVSLPVHTENETVQSVTTPIDSHFLIVVYCIRLPLMKPSASSDHLLVVTYTFFYMCLERTSLGQSKSWLGVNQNQFKKKKIWRTSFLWGYWYPFLALLVTFQARVGSLIRTWQSCMCYMFPEIYLWCNTYWPVGSEHGSEAILFHVPLTKHWWGSKPGSIVLPLTVLDQNQNQFYFLGLETKWPFWYLDNLAPMHHLLDTFPRGL